MIFLENFKEKNKNDKQFIKNFEKITGDGISIDELNKILIEKKFENFELVKGDIKKTIPKFLKKKSRTQKLPFFI